MRSVVQLLFVLLVLTVSSLAAGCSGSYGGRTDIAGTVTLEGKPLRAGQIHFVPLDKQDSDSGGPIVDGSYKISGEHGLQPGWYLVQITSGDGRTPNASEVAQPGGSANIVSMDWIPDDWGQKSTQKIEVKPSGENKFDFPIPHANPRMKRPY